MAVLIQKTFQARAGRTDRAWHLVDGSGQVLGRLAVRLATILMGKHKPTYTPHVDTGDFVVLINAEKVSLTGSKARTMTYQRFSGYPGGKKVLDFERVLARHPERVIQLAVRRMLPKNKLGRHMLSKLKVYRGSQHPHQAQQPSPLALQD